MKRLLTLSLPLLLIPAVAFAAQRAGGDDLRRLVGDDVGLCIEFHDLAGHQRELVKSDIARRLQKSPLFAQLRQSKPFREMAKARKHIEGITGQPLPTFLNGLFGRSVILAVYPTDGREPTGVLLTRAADSKTLRSALKAWQRAEPKRVASEIPYRGVNYVRFAKKDDPKPLFYAVIGDVLALSDRDAAVKKVIRLSQAAKKSAALNTLEIYTEARKSIQGRPVATAFVNPRRWDAALGFDDSSAVRNRVPAAIWQSCRWIMGTLRVENGFVLDAVVRFDAKSLPEASRKSLRRLQGKPGFLERVPADALAVAAGRFDPLGMYAALQLAGQGDNAEHLKQMRGFASAMLGFDPMEDVLPNLRQSYGFFVVGRSSTDSRVPFAGLAAIEIAPVSKTKSQNDWRDKLESGLSNVMRFLVTTRNLNAAKQAKPQLAAVKIRRTKAVSLHWAEPLATYRPAFGLSANYLSFASDPDLIETFTTGPKKRLVNDARFRRWRTRYFAGHQQVAFVNVALLREHLRRNEKFFVAKWSQGNDAGKTAGRLQSMLQAFGLIDGVFTAVKTSDEEVRLTFGALAAK